MSLNMLLQYSSIVNILSFNNRNVSNTYQTSVLDVQKTTIMFVKQRLCVILWPSMDTFISATTSDTPNEDDLIFNWLAEWIRFICRTSTEDTHILESTFSIGFCRMKQIYTSEANSIFFACGVVPTLHFSMLTKLIHVTSASSWIFKLSHHTLAIVLSISQSCVWHVVSDLCDWRYPVWESNTSSCVIRSKSLQHGSGAMFNTGWAITENSPKHGCSKKPKTSEWRNRPDETRAKATTKASAKARAGIEAVADAAKEGQSSRTSIHWVVDVDFVQSKLPPCRLLTKPWGSHICSSWSRLWTRFR